MDNSAKSSYAIRRFEELVKENLLVEVNRTENRVVWDAADPYEMLLKDASTSLNRLVRVENKKTLLLIGPSTRLMDAIRDQGVMITGRDRDDNPQLPFGECDCSDIDKIVDAFRSSVKK